MDVIRNISDFVKAGNSVVTIGTFDGVHLGHRKIFDKVNELKSSKKLRSVAVTFDPHPQVVLKNRSKDVKLLTTASEKLELFKDCGIDTAFVINFTREFASTPAEDFLRKYLIEGIGLSDLVIGYDHMFGKNREGDKETLRRLSKEYGFDIHEVGELRHGDKTVSSTEIRKLIEAGDVKEAAKLLGRSYGLEGEVVRGDARGREFGFPTANIEVKDENKLIPAKGIYAVTAEVKEAEYRGVMSIGTNPTVTDKNELRLEVNIFDFDDDIYDEKISVRFADRIRGEWKFETADELIAEMHKDKAKADEILRLYTDKKN